MVYISFYFFDLFCLQKNELNTLKVIFSDVIGSSAEVYHFILLNSSIEIIYIPNIAKYIELLTFRVIFAINRSDSFTKNGNKIRIF